MRIFGNSRFSFVFLEFLAADIPFKDNNAGKELSAASISRWICTTIVDSHASLQSSMNTEDWDILALQIFRAFFNLDT